MKGKKLYFAYLNAIVVGKQFKCKESNPKLRKNLNNCKYLALIGRLVKL